MYKRTFHVNALSLLYINTAFDLFAKLAKIHGATKCITLGDELRVFNDILHSSHTSHIRAHTPIKMAFQIRLIVILLLVVQFDNQQIDKLEKMPRKIINSKEEWDRQAIVIVESITDAMLTFGCANLDNFTIGKYYKKSFHFVS